MPEEQRLASSAGRCGVALLVAALACYALLIVLIAWVCDDAFITFRTVDNFVNGYGLRWNVADRVQSYTHPLWMLLHIPFFAIGSNPVYGTIAVSALLSVAAVSVMAVRLPQDNFRGAALVVVCLSSKAFAEYSTSGLENPLSFFLLALFVAALRSDGPPDPRVLFLIAGLAATNRADSLLLYAPVLIGCLVVNGFRSTLKPALLGMSPFWVWSGFAYVYYGFVSPNTAYAKLATGIDQWALLEQGSAYFVNSVAWDPVTFLVCLAGIAAAAAVGNRLASCLAIGVVASLAYVLVIGGDFMSGRFLGLPFFASLCLIAMARTRMRNLLVLAVGAMVVALTFDRNPVAQVFGRGRAADSLITSEGIADERAHYLPMTGLWTVVAHSGQPQISWAAEGKALRDSPQRLAVRHAVGFLGYYAGPEVHIVDTMALSDAFLARLPVADTTRWRIGHFSRSLPRGYLESLATGRVALEDPGLARFYAAIRSVTSDPILSGGRWKSMAELVFGGARDVVAQRRRLVSGCDVDLVPVAARSDQAVQSSRVLISEGKLRCAEQVLESIVSSGDDIDAWELYASLGNRYFQRDQVDRAIPIFRRVSARWPSDPVTLFNLGTAHKSQGDFRGAETCYLAVLQLRPEMQGAWQGLDDLRLLATSSVEAKESR